MVVEDSILNFDWTTKKTATSKYVVFKCNITYKWYVYYLFCTNPAGYSFPVQFRRYIDPVECLYTCMQYAVLE